MTQFREIERQIDDEEKKRGKLTTITICTKPLNIASFCINIVIINSSNFETFYITMYLILLYRS